MTININLGMSGAYKAKVLDKEGNIVQETDWFDNLLVDEFFEEWFTKGGSAVSTAACLVGTGTTPPTVTDTGIENGVANVSNGANGDFTYQIASAPYYTQTIKDYDFGFGTINTTLTEVAIRSSASPTSGFTTSRALFPTPLEITDQQQLILSYRMRCYFPDQDIVSTVGSYDVTLRPSLVGNSNIWLPQGNWSTSGGTTNGRIYTSSIGDIDSLPTGGNVSRSSYSNSTYTTGDMFRSRTYVWGPDIANQSNTSVYLEVGHAWQAQFSPTIDKTNTERLEITIQITVSRV